MNYSNLSFNQGFLTFLISRHSSHSISASFLILGKEEAQGMRNCVLSPSRLNFTSISLELTHWVHG